MFHIPLLGREDSDSDAVTTTEVYRIFYLDMYSRENIYSNELILKVCFKCPNIMHANVDEHNTQNIN